MNTIRVALIEMKPRLRDLLTEVVGRERDMEVVHMTAGADLAANPPDVMVCQIQDPLDVESPGRLLRAVPCARVLMVADSGDRAVLYELQPARKVLLDVSIDQLIAAIRFGFGPRVERSQLGKSVRD